MRISNKYTQKQVILIDLIINIKICLKMKNH